MGRQPIIFTSPPVCATTLLLFNTQQHLDLATTAVLSLPPPPPPIAVGTTHRILRHRCRHRTAAIAVSVLRERSGHHVSTTGDKDEEKCSKDATTKIAPGIIIEDNGTLTASRLHGMDRPTTFEGRSYNTTDNSVSWMLTSTYSGTETFTDTSSMSSHTDDNWTYESAEFDDDIESEDGMES